MAARTLDVLWGAFTGAAPGGNAAGDAGRHAGARQELVQLGGARHAHHRHSGRAAYQPGSEVGGGGSGHRHSGRAAYQPGSEVGGRGVAGT
eukprot:539383-Prymnesium_polylepis.1